MSIMIAAYDAGRRNEACAKNILVNFHKVTLKVLL